MKLENKVAIVTRLVAVVSVMHYVPAWRKKEGKIVVNYRSSKDEAEEVKQKVEQIGSEALIVQADLSKVEQIDNLVRETINHFGKVDILVNNAGLEKRADFWDVYRR